MFVVQVLLVVIDCVEQGLVDKVDIIVAFVN
jgi:hypothetical protein